MKAETLGRRARNSGHPFPDLRSWCAKRESSEELQIVSLIKQLFINQEILLFRTNGGDNAGHIFISEEFQDTQRLAVDGSIERRRGVLVSSASPL